MGSFPFIIGSALLFNIVVSTPIPTLSITQSSTPTRPQPREATTTASSSDDAWFKSQSKGIQILIIIGGIIGLLLFAWILTKTCNGWDRVKGKYFARPSRKRDVPRTQIELNRCWELYGEKDVVGRPRPATLAELKALWAVNGLKVRARNRPSGSGGDNNAGGGDSGGGAAGDGGDGGG